MSIGWNGDLRTASLYFRDVPAGLQDACTKAADELERRQEAKRAALKVADERSAENVKLRKLAEMARAVLDTFRKDEAQGYRSKDRQFAIELLAKGFEIAALDEQTLNSDKP